MNIQSIRIISKNFCSAFWGAFFCFFMHVSYAGQAPLLIQALTPTTVQNSGSGTAVVQYQVTNILKHAYRFAMVPLPNVTQISTLPGSCSSPFALNPQSSCVLVLEINRNQLTSFNDGLKLCVTNSSDNPGSFMCSKPSVKDELRVETIDPAFPYGNAPSGNVCVSSDYYATPETMLGSWAFLDAVKLDVQGNVLPSFLNASNVVYAVGTAAIGDALGINNCSGGCNELNGYCFALKFNDKPSYPYMIFQSVNIGANNNSFDIYLAGGGSGAFPAPCQQFWNSSNVNWANHIEDAASCDDYFNNYSSMNPSYSVTYNGVVHPAKETLQNACTFASANQSGFNTQNWSNVTVVPVSCPQSMVQITGIELPSSITTVGNQPILNLSSLSENDFTASTIKFITTTQMQDCKTPSSGYCHNVESSVPNYEASISASTTAPLLSGPPPSNTYCQEHPSISYCSWDNGNTSSGGSYCNANVAQCIQCGKDSGSKWCVCHDKTLQGCQAGILGSGYYERLK